MTQKRTVEKASKKDVREWASDYGVPELDDMFDKAKSKISYDVEAAIESALDTAIDRIRDGIRTNVVKAFGDFVADENKYDLFIEIDEHDPSIVRASFGGPESDLTPHVVQSTQSITELAQWAAGGCERRDYLENMRAQFIAAIEIIDKQLSELSS